MEIGTDFQSTIVSAKDESNSLYPGFAYRYESGSMSLSGRWPGQTDVKPTDSTAFPKHVVISRRNSVLYYKFGNNAEKTLINVPAASLTSDFVSNLVFGAAINGSGQPFRFAKAYMSNIKVTLSD